MKLFVPILWLLTAYTVARSAVIVRVGDDFSKTEIANDFVGLSFESSNLLPDKSGNYLFSSSNQNLVHLFRTIGIRSLRIGGGTADLPQYRIPAPADIDQLFGFAKAADVKVIYTLRLLNGSAKDDAEIARYIQQHYAPQLVCFQIGNEPDWHSYHTALGHAADPRIFEPVLNSTGSAFPSFLGTWNTFASTINDSVPNAKYTGPDTGSNHPVPGTKNTDFDGQSWTRHFAHDEKASGRLLFVAQHDYVGQSATGIGPATAIASMLSRDWVQSRYPLLFEHVLAPVQADGLSYRMTEANDYTSGVDGASNAYASALWALDYLHWHAAHHAVGVNFHNKRWIYTDTIYLDRSGELRFNPKAYAIRAFDVGSHGSVMSLTITNPDKINLTAYAVRGPHELYVTLINKEFGPKAPTAEVTIGAAGLSGRAAGMFLQAPDSEVTVRTGITFGGSTITADAWDGQWTALNPCEHEQTTLRVPAASAVVVKIGVK